MFTPAKAIDTHFSIPKTSSRRSFLRSTAACLALPALESIRSQMANGAVAVGKAVPSAKRMVCIGNSFGMYLPQFFPKEAGAAYTMTPLLEPIARHRANFTIFSHLDHAGSARG